MLKEMSFETSQVESWNLPVVKFGGNLSQPCFHTIIQGGGFGTREDLPATDNIYRGASRPKKRGSNANRKYYIEPINRNDPFHSPDYTSPPGINWLIALHVSQHNRAESKYERNPTPKNWQKVIDTDKPLPKALQRHQNL